MASDTLRQVTGTFKSPDGTVFANQTLKWYRARREVRGQGATVVVDAPFEVATDASGEIDDMIMPGNYRVMAPLSDAQRFFIVVVPDQAGPLNVADLIDADPVSETVADEVRALTAQARAWATSPVDEEPDPDDHPGEFSALHWASSAAEAARDAAASAAEADAPFSTVAAMVAANLSAGLEVSTLGCRTAGDGGGARYRIADSTTEAASFYETLSNGRVAVLLENTVHPLQVGYDADADNMTTIGAVDANWTIMKNLIAHVRASATRQLPKFDQIWTPEAIFAEWLAGRNAPVGFYSDSTTDGATTTGHTSSVENVTPFGVTITESPAAYPKVLENYVDKVTNLTTTARCYNGGFDSESFKSGFGLDQWYNVWFRGTDGANVDFSDVAMIVVGFGTTDSIPPSPGDVAGTIDAYEEAVECVILDCFLRGVQPALQGPVMTFHNGGTTIAYRDADESVTVIEAIQKRLADKYNLPHFSMAEPVQKAIDNWEGYTWRELFANDGVHPSDMGHRLHAGYLLSQFNRNIPRLTAEKPSIVLGPGHPAFIMGDHSDNIFPPSSDGFVLQRVNNIAKSRDSYIYEWLDSESNGKTAGEELVRVAIWCEKPAMLYQTAVENNRTAKKPISLESMTLFDIDTGGDNLFDTQTQPETEYYSLSRRLFFLHLGLNIVYVHASSDGPDQKLGGFEVIDAKCAGEWTVSRGSTGASYLSRTVRHQPSYDTYTWKSANRQRRPAHEFYNSADLVNYWFDFELFAALAPGTTYSIYTHLQDLADFNEGYNVLEIAGDDVTIKTKDATTTTTINTRTITGLNAKLVAGAKVTLRFRSRYANSLGLQVALLVDGAVEYGFTSAIGDMWTDGAGFEAPDVLMRNPVMISSDVLRLTLDITKIF